MPVACPVIQPIKVTPIHDNQHVGIIIISVFLHGIVWNTERCQTIVIDGVLNAKQGTIQAAAETRSRTEQVSICITDHKRNIGGFHHSKCNYVG